MSRFLNDNLHDLHRTDPLPMSWKIAIAVALLTGLITALVTIPVADKMTRLLGVPDREGGRGMLVVFILIPAGFIGGLLLGLLGAKLMHVVEWSQFWKTTGVSLLMSHAALFGIAGLASLSIVHPPLLDGHALALEIEVTVPVRLMPDGKITPKLLQMSLYAGDKDNQYAEVDTAHVVQKDGIALVRAEARLNSKADFRMLSFHNEGVEGFALDPLPLPRTPTEKDLQWTEPMPMREAKVTGTKYTYTEVMLRYRVVKKELVKEK